MIPRDDITAWRAEAPWRSDLQVEQDLVLSRALVEIFRVEAVSRRLALRGGAALHKLHLRPAARYTEDVDLVQVAREPIGETFDAIRAVLDPWLGAPRRLIKERRVNLIYRLGAEGGPRWSMRLELKINSREQLTELGYVHAPLEVRSRWWSGAAEIRTFALDEVLGTKLRALYQRRKGRDLFDLGYALARGAAAPARVIACFERYMREEGHRVARAAFEENLRQKLEDLAFREDVTPLLRPGLDWDADRAGEAVARQLLSRLAD